MYVTLILTDIFPGPLGIWGQSLPLKYILKVCRLGMSNLKFVSMFIAFPRRIERLEGGKGGFVRAFEEDSEVFL